MSPRSSGQPTGAALLDINILLALLDQDHTDHSRARRWLEQEIHQGWASCPITQNGFLRIISQPRYPSPVSPDVAREKLTGATSSDYHHFWPCDISLLRSDRINWKHVLGPRQITDVYLLSLAVEHGGRFATFDRGVPLAAVSGATGSHLIVL